MLSSLDYLTLFLLASLAFMLDWVLGEPKRFHPLVGFGWLANKIESWFNRHPIQPLQRYWGVCGLLVIILPWVLLAQWLCALPRVGHGIHGLLLYFAVGHQSLHVHARAVTHALEHDGVPAAKLTASYMVSRDSAAIDPIPATVESVLENGNDGVFGALFWFVLFGGVGALAFRLINTMDAMWGYKTPRYFYFGWAAARLDDVVSYLPARLTAITYALLGNTQLALRCWRAQAPLWDSPNAGPVMSAGAGALNVTLGGAACYQGEWHQRPVLGAGVAPEITDIERALVLVRHGVYLWLSVLLVMSVLHA